MQRTRKPRQGVVHEFFDRGRPLSLREHLMQDDASKELHFYSEVRVDGLVKRVESEDKVSPGSQLRGAFPCFVLVAGS
jgi:hypothetical protein